MDSIGSDMAQGYKTKHGKTLEQVLKTTKKEEAQLIGYDETPLTQAILLDIKLEDSDIQDTSSAAKTTGSCTMMIDVEPANIPIIRQPISKPERCNSDDVSSSSSTATQNEEFSYTGSAKSRLHEICARNYWDPPVFECIKEEGNSHLMMFTFKVTVQVQEASKTTLECYSEPRSRKKAAMDHAADGALWYLHKQGYKWKGPGY